MVTGMFTPELERKLPQYQQEPRAVFRNWETDFEELGQEAVRREEAHF